LLGCTAKFGKNGRLGGRRGKTGSRNMAATQKINFLTLVSYSLLQTVFLLGRTVSPQYIRQKNGRLGGRSGETGSRNMAATQKINFLALVSFSLLQTVFR